MITDVWIKVIYAEVYLEHSAFSDKWIEVLKYWILIESHVKIQGTCQSN